MLKPTNKARVPGKLSPRQRVAVEWVGYNSKGMPMFLRPLHIYEGTLNSLKRRGLIRYTKQYVQLTAAGKRALQEIYQETNHKGE